MTVSAIIAEYNPFHKGHAYQLAKTKELTGSDYTVAVMSGNFAQRGIPCIVDKFTRTRMALENGVDMVLELPTPFAIASAERFAQAAVSLLVKSQIVDYLSFGSEIGDLSLLNTLADCLNEEPQPLSLKLQNYLKEGISFPRARALATSFYLQNSYSSELVLKVLACPNNILGIEYLKACKKYGATFTPITVKRIVSGYHDKSLHKTIASASAIREHYGKPHHASLIANAMPDLAFKRLQNATQHVPQLDNFNTLLQYKLIFSKPQDFYALWDVPEDLVRSLFKTYGKFFSIQDIVKILTSKTYSKATVQRFLLKSLLDIQKENITPLESISWIPYIRVLGVKKHALPLLSQLTQNATVPVITNLKSLHLPQNSFSRALLDIETRATALYHLTQKQVNHYQDDFTTPFLKV
jgi:predicted nucleotidyltransferase